MGQSNAGMSILWIYFECVVERAPKVRPWNSPWNDMTERVGDPGD
ncbi:hypothetical protein L798_15779 [Zootermopsis nevadensis]|uniref:Uncharacterized protein n=1 Tax=Zootermopsis nevadensis TaxID=136037 RepID=A0A067QL54_ZOONE|nr:hypothetical protein L798_15779 [Zootermopsis nevadensis]